MNKNTYQITSNTLINREDFYPFGMIIESRAGASTDYRYGFNGMEQDDEVKGKKGTHLDFGNRCYDTRVGRFFKFGFLRPQVLQFITV